MNIPITRSRLIQPHLKSEIVSRQRLLDLLFDLMEYKLVIVAAPAGYGKTSLLIDFANKIDLAVCWYSVDALDQDPSRFIAHFLSAIRMRFPNFGKLSLAALENINQNKLDLDHIVNTFVNEAVESIQEHFLLVVDDYHLVNEQKEISTFISRLIQEVDENCHLVLSSRSLLTLPDMPLMVARSMVGGLSFEELSFQVDEIQSLMQQNYRQLLSRTAAEQLANSTEGWITGLLLSTEAIHQGLVDRQRLGRVSKVNLYDYLVEQVMEQQPVDVQTFLLYTAMLEEFDVSLCQAILGDSLPWQSLFDYVLVHNLFVLPVGEDGKSIRYHHLFRDFLQERLEKKYPEERNQILHRMGAYYSGKQDWEIAHAIYKRLDDRTNLVDLIEMAGQTLINNSRLNLLADWIDELPESIVKDRPNLLYLRAIPEIVWGNIERGIELLRTAEKGQRLAGDNLALARTLARAAMTERLLGRYSAALQAAEEALDLTTGVSDWIKIRAEALRAIGSVLYYTGQASEAIDKFNQSLAIYQSLDDRQNSTAVLMDLGFAYQAAGSYRKAFINYDGALSYWLEANNSVRQASLLNNLGVLQHLSGNYEQAAAALEKALLLSRQNKLARVETLALCSLGDIFSDLEAYDAAIDAFRTAREFAQRINYTFLLLYSSLAMAACYRQRGELDLSKYYLSSIAGRMDQSHSHYEKGLYFLEVGRLNQSEGKTQVAIDYLQKSIQELDKAGQTVEAARACLPLANAYFSLGWIEEAIKWLDAAFDWTSQMESDHVLVVASRPIKNLLDTLIKPPHHHSKAARLYQLINAFETNIPALRKRLRTRSPNITFTPPRLVIRALGAGNVELNGSIVTVPEWQNQKKVREIFYYLLSHPGGLTKEEIGLVFWPESSSAQLKLQFKNFIYRLRHALGPEIVVFDTEYYRFNQDLDYEYDVEQFQHEYYEAGRTVKLEQKKDRLKHAIKLYQGPFLPEADGVWAFNIRQQLQEMFIQANLTLAQILFEEGDATLSLEYCQRILETDACLEEAHRLAMRIYAARGNRAGIHRQFEKCLLALLNEINALPSPQTISLYESLNR